MPVRRTLLLVLAAGLLLLPQATPGGAITAQTSANGVLRVVVRFAGQPLAGMTVIVNNSASNPNPWNNYTIPNLTNGQGALDVSLPPGNYDVHIAEPAPNNNVHYGSQVLYDVGVGSGSDIPLAFELDRPGGTMSGVVRNGAGNPVSGVKVEAFGSFALGDQPPYGWGDTFTDGAGRFTIPRLLPNGWYVVFVSALGYRMDQVPVVANSLTAGVDFPGTVYRGPGPQRLAPSGSLPTLGGDVPIVGDWDGNGTTTVGVRRGGTMLLRNANTTGAADVAAGFGDPADLGLAGDWDGNGTTTVGVWRAGTFYLRNANSTGVADIAAGFGNADDIPLVGDWDGNGTDTVGIWRRGTFYLRNANTTGVADVAVNFGGPDDVPVVGDWDGNGTDTVGVWRRGTFYLRNANTTSADADGLVGFGNPDDVPVVGDWDGNRSDTVGVRRSTVFYLANGSGRFPAADAVVGYGGATTRR